MSKFEYLYPLMAPFGLLGMVHLSPISGPKHTARIIIMVLILDGDSEIGAHVRSDLCYMICLSISRKDLC